MAQPASSSRPARLSSYRPSVDRFVFGLALLGVFVTVHLWVQQRRGFADGCLGFGELGEGSFDCAAVLQSGASELFGVSNVVWGFLFYVVVAVLSFVIARVGPGRRATLKQARLGVLGFGFLYSAYLVVYQWTQVGQWCALCLTSAALVTAMLAFQLYDYFTASDRPATAMNTRLVKKETRLLAALAVVVLLVSGADALYFNGAEGSAQTALASVAGSDTLQVAEGCYYDPEKGAVVDPDQLVGMSDPVKGNPEGDVTVLEYFDPNCPHCRTFYPQMQELIAQYGDRVRFVYKPIPLWEFSIPQIEALYAAQQQGKFTAMLEGQFANQSPNGLSLAQMKAIAQEIGMDAEAMEARIRSGLFRMQWQQSRQQAGEIGLTGVPSVLIDGRFVAGPSRTPRCLALMIEDAVS